MRQNGCWDKMRRFGVAACYQALTRQPATLKTPTVLGGVVDAHQFHDAVKTLQQVKMNDVID